MTNENKDNEDKIETVEYVCKVNQKVLYNRMANLINEKLNQAIKSLQHDIVNPLVFSFPSAEIARHFADQFEAHGWSVTLDDAQDIIRVDIVASVDKALRDEDNKDDDDIGDGGFFADEVISLH